MITEKEKKSKTNTVTPFLQRSMDLKWWLDKGREQNILTTDRILKINGVKLSHTV
jgi:hypothetical protein